jgi:hypothetical protein
MPRTAVILAVLLLAFPATAFGDWSPPKTLADGTVYRFSPVAAANPNGDAVAIWTHWYDEYTTSVEGSWRTGNGPWSPQTTLSGEIRYLAGGGNNPTIQPTVAVNDAGEAAAAWTKGNADSGYDLYVSTKPARGDFGRAVMLSGPELKTVYYPTVGIDAAGDVLVLWEDMDDRSIYVAEAPRGGKFGPPQTIAAPDRTSLAYDVSMAVSANGDAAIGWAARRHRYLQIRRADGTLESAIDVRQPGDCAFAAGARVAADAHGDFLAHWGETIGADCRGEVIRYAWRGAGEATFGSTHQIVLTPGGGAGGLGLSRDGHATLVYSWNLPDYSPLAAADAPLLGEFGPPVVIGPQTGSNVQVAFDANDNTYVGWWDWNDAIFGEQSHTIMRPAGGKWHAPAAMTESSSGGMFLAGMRDSALAALQDPLGIQVRTGTPDSGSTTPQPPDPGGSSSTPGAQPGASSAVPSGQGSSRSRRHGPKVVTIHVRTSHTGRLIARLVRGKHRYASLTRHIRRPGVTSIALEVPGIARGRYTVELTLTVRGHRHRLPARRVTVAG